MATAAPWRPPPVTKAGDHPTQLNLSSNVTHLLVVVVVVVCVAAATSGGASSVTVTGVAPWAFPSSSSSSSGTAHLRPKAPMASPGNCFRYASP
jgi:hypothetical protein